MHPAKRDERASALMLVPAGVLILLLLASISVDSAIAFMAKRELTNQAEAAANDAVTMAISPDELQMGARALPDPAAARVIATNALVGQRVDGVIIAASDVDVAVDGPNVTVTVTKSVPYLFAKAVRGRPTQMIRATATATVRSRLL